MRRLTINLVIALLTLTTGVIGSYLAHGLFTRRASVNRGIQEPAVSAPCSTAGSCEVHGSALKPVRVQGICGEYSGSDGRYVSVGCASPKKRLISPEDAPFLIRAGGLKTFRWFADND